MKSLDKFCKHCNQEHPLTPEHWRFLSRGYTCRIKHRKDTARWKRLRPDKHRENCSKYRERKRQLNPPKIPMGKELRAKLKYQRHKERLARDPEYKLKITLRKRLKKALKAQSTIKTSKFKELLGCTNKELKVYLEGKFAEGMTWNNYGKEWHIDHIIPLSKLKLTEEKEIQIATHYTNLQPLWAKDNLVKSNRWWFQ